jgi:arsenate reductase
MMEKEDQKGSILFVCVENAGRSQMAQAFSQKYGLNSESAGTMPSSRINPTVVEVMKEIGIDISKNVPRILTPEMISRASLVVTMGCSVAEVCPRPVLAQMQKKLVDWNLTDPKGKPIEKVREIRDEIEKRVLGLIAESRSVSA